MVDCHVCLFLVHLFVYLLMLNTSQVTLFSCLTIPPLLPLFNYNIRVSSEGSQPLRFTFVLFFCPVLSFLKEPSLFLYKLPILCPFLNYKLSLLFKSYRLRIIPSFGILDFTLYLSSNMSRNTPYNF